MTVRTSWVERAIGTSRVKQIGLGAGGFAAAALLGSLVAPAAAFFLGGLALAVVALHVASPTARPFLEGLLRLPVGAPRRRRARLVLVAGAGLVLLVGGSVGARVSGRMSVERAEEARRRAHDEGRVEALLELARGHLDAAELAEAELALMDAGAIAAADAGLRREVEELLDAVRDAARPDR